MDTLYTLGSEWGMAISALLSQYDMMYTGYGITPPPPKLQSIEQACQQAGIDLYAGDASGNTALHFFAAHGYESIVYALIEKGIDVNKQNHLGNTPLHFAVQREDNIKVISILLMNGANPYTKDDYGCDAWDFAATYDPTLILCFFRGKNMSISKEGNNF